MTDEGFDIYADIEDFDAKQQLETLKNEVNKLQHQLEDKDHLISSLEADNTKIWKINKSLLYNMSALMKTAKLEAARKDKIITELRKEKDEILFRRDRNKTTRKPPNNISSDNIRNSSKSESPLCNISLNKKHEETSGSLGRTVESKSNTKRKLSEDDKCAVKRCKSENIPTEKKTNSNSIPNSSLKSSINTCSSQFPDKSCNKNEVGENTNNKSHLLDSRNSITNHDSEVRDISVENDKKLLKLESDLKNNEMTKCKNSHTISKEYIIMNKETNKVDKIRECNNAKNVSKSSKSKYQSKDDEKRYSNKSYKDNNSHRRASSKDRRHEKKDRYDESRRDKPRNRSRDREDRHKQVSSKSKTSHDVSSHSEDKTNKKKSKIEESIKDKENMENPENIMISDSDTKQVNDLKDLLDKKKALLKELTQATDVIYESDFPTIKQGGKADNLNNPTLNIHYSIENVVLLPGNDILVDCNMTNNYKNSNKCTAGQVALTEKSGNKKSAFTNKSDHFNKTNNNHYSKIQIDNQEKDKHHINVINDDHLNGEPIIKDNCSIRLNNEINTNVELNNMAEFINKNNNEGYCDDTIASHSSAQNENQLELVKYSVNNKTNIETNIMNGIRKNNQKPIDDASKTTENVLAQLLGIDSPEKIVPNYLNTTKENFDVNETTQGVVKTNQCIDNQKGYEMVCNADGQLENNSNSKSDKSLEKIRISQIENEQKDTSLNDSGSSYTLSSHITKYECAVDNRNCYKIKLNRVKRRKING